MTLSVRLNDRDAELVKGYAAINNKSVSDVIRQAIIERIEDEYDLRAYEKALAEYRKNPVRYSHEEVKKMLESDGEI